MINFWSPFHLASFATKTQNCIVLNASPVSCTQHKTQNSSSSTTFLFCKIKTFPRQLPHNSHFPFHHPANSNPFPTTSTTKCRFALIRKTKSPSRPVVVSFSATGVAAVEQGQDSKYSNGWGMKRIVKVAEETRKVAHVQAVACSSTSSSISLE